MKHAVVIGGSMAGLLATRALSGHFERVTLLERDQFPGQPENRRGVPQGRHSHGLLAGGRQEIERFFPGITDELVAAGALRGDIVGDTRWFFEGGCLAQFASGLEALTMSRPLLEANVRRRTMALPNVETRQDCHVEGLAAIGDQRRIIGVKTIDGLIEADLVVDATGRGSKTPAWLHELGYDSPIEQRVEVALGYTTRIFRRSPGELGGNMAAVIPPTPKGKRGGVIIAQEGDRWTVTLISHFGPHAPPDLPGFIEFAKTIPAPYIYEIVRQAEPLGDAMHAGMPASVRRRYEMLERFPEGYLVIGDAICSFNPIYGQGMTVAAQEARVLDETLRHGGTKGLSQRFFERTAKTADNPWTIAVGNDLRMPEAKGPRSTAGKFVSWYMAKLHRAAHKDRELALAFHKVSNLLAPPPSVMHPRLVWRVLVGGA